MAKRKRADCDGDEPVEGCNTDIPSDLMKAPLLHNTRMPDMNIVEPKDTHLGDITPEPEQLSESELPPGPESKKKVSLIKSSDGTRKKQDNKKTPGPPQLKACETKH